MTFTEYQNKLTGRKIRVEYEPVNFIYTVFQDSQKLSMTTREYLSFVQNLAKYDWKQVPFNEIEVHRAA